MVVTRHTRVVTSEIADGGVGSVDIATGAVYTAKIASKAVDQTKTDQIVQKGSATPGTVTYGTVFGAAPIVTISRLADWNVTTYPTYAETGTAGITLYGSPSGYQSYIAVGSQT